MQAVVGDRLHVHGRGVGDPGKIGEIVEIHGKEGAPPYLVKFTDGHTGLVFPGPDAVVEHPAGRKATGSSARSKAGSGAERASGPGSKRGTGTRQSSRRGQR
jgi:hypothetical protein